MIESLKVERKWLRIWALVSLAACSASPIAAQQAGVSGIVIDPQGNSIPHAAVTLAGEGANARQTATADGQGAFSFAAVELGQYTVTAEAPGFARTSFSKLTVTQAGVVNLKLTLDIMHVSERVDVSAEAIQLNTENGAVSTTITSEQVQALTANGGNLQQAFSVVPGVLLVPGSISTGQFVVNGQRADANVFTVDGVSGNSVAYGGGGGNTTASGNLPALNVIGGMQSFATADAIEELHVQTATYSAEYGRQPGGQFQVVTKSGTNTLHGDVYGVVRNEAFDAKTWFSNANRQPKGKLREGQFGGTAGGPVVIPHLFNGRDKLFFFIAVEDLAFNNPNYVTLDSPNAALRASAAPILQQWLQVIPPGNGIDLGNGMTALNLTVNQPTHVYSGSARIDYHISSKLYAFFRYSNSPSEQQYSYPTYDYDYHSTFHSETAGLTWLISPKLANELHANWTYGTNHIPYNYTRSSTFDIFQNMPSVYRNTHGTVVEYYLYAPGSGSSYIISEDNYNIQRQLNFTDGLSWSVGSHNLKFGTDLRWLFPTNVPYPLAITYEWYTGANYNNAQTGIANYFGTQSELPTKPRVQNYSFYAQDTWKVNSRLTVNFGVRWDINPAPGLSGGVPIYNVSGIDTGNPSIVQVPRLWNTQWHNFGPRAGFAYSFSNAPGRQTVFRMGSGLFYDVGNEAGTANDSYWWPYYVYNSYSNITYPAPANIISPPVTPAPVTPPYGFMYVSNPHLKMPVSYQWTATLERQLGNNLYTSASYVGTVGKKLIQTKLDEIYQVNQNFSSDLEYSNNGAFSDYHALQLQLQARGWKGLNMLVNYAWSHAIDDTAANTVQSSYIPLRGNSDNNIPQVFHSVINYTLKNGIGNGLLGALTRGWGMDLKVQIQSGVQFSIYGGYTFLPPNGTLEYLEPNAVPGVPQWVADPHAPGGYRVNAAAFSLPSGGGQGNLARNAMRAFADGQADATLRRDFQIGEKSRIQFRWDVFNLTNHPSFGTFYNNITVPGTFGVASNTQGDNLGGLSSVFQTGESRAMQLALKYIF